MASNWQQTFEQLKKRKKEVDKVSNASEIKKIDTKYQQQSNNILETSYAPTNRTLLQVPNYSRTIAPTTTTKKNNDKKWYQKFFKSSSAFDDGYDIGDITKSLLGTAGDLENKMAKGVVSIYEAPIDIGSRIVQTGLDLVGLDKASEKVKKFADTDYSKKLADSYSKNMSLFTSSYDSVSNMQDEYSKFMEEYESGKETDAKQTLKNMLKSGGKGILNLLTDNKLGIDDKEKIIEEIENDSISGDTLDKVAELTGYVLSMSSATKALDKFTGTKRIGNVTTNAAGKTVGTGATLSGGNVGVTIAGKTLNVPTVAVASGMASGLNEAYSKEDVSHIEAWSKGISSGLIEGITEGLFGLAGVGGSSIDEIGENAIKQMSTSFTKQLANIGIKGIQESGEELASYGLNYLADNDLIDKLGDADFSTKWDWNEVGEQMALAFISSGAMQGSGVALGTNNAIAEAEKQLGRKLTKQEKADITQQVIDAEIKETQQQTQVQEETQDPIAPIAEETQQEEITEQVEDIAPTKEVIPPTVEQELTNITNQIDELETMLDTNLNATQQQEVLTQIKVLEQRYNEIQQQGQTQDEAVFKTASQQDVQNQEIAPIQEANVEQISQPTTQQVESNLTTEVESNTQNIETAAKRRNFTYDSEKVTNEYSQATYESASRVMNDTERSHKFVDVVAKIATEKNTKYEFTNNEDIKSRGYNIEGKQVNGLVTVEENGETKILINIDSPKALNIIVGHETTHLLEGTQEYKDLQDTIFEYAKTKGELDDRKAKLHSLYKDVKGADVNSELTADLVGDYLFTDSKFIESLSVEKPTLFQKIKELIDDLVIRFKGTKEEKQLREVQKKFKEAYKQNVTSKETNAKYSIAGLKGAKNTNNEALINLYNQAYNMSKQGIDNETIRQKTRWFQDKNGDWKFEVSDKDFILKRTLNKNGNYKLGEIVEHDTLFMLYPQLEELDVVFENTKNSGGYNHSRKKIILSNNNFNSNTNYQRIKETLIHEMQHAIQHIENFEHGTSARFNKLNYANNLGEIEATDTSDRLTMSYEERQAIAPESSKENPVHPFRKEILDSRGIIEKMRDGVYNFFKEGTGKNENNKKSKSSNSKNYIEHDNSMGYRNSEGQKQELDNSSFFNTKYSLSDTNNHKQQQLDIILKENPMTDDYHTGIRTIEDIKTFDEVIDDDESFVWGDFSQEDAKKALEKGEVTVYSSYPIEQGVFVSTSKNQARDYAGSGKIYSKTVPLNEVAWINGDEGQYAKVENENYSLSNQNEDIAPIGNYNVYGDEVKLQVKEAVKEIAPVQKEIKTLTKEVKTLTKELQEVKKIAEVGKPVTLADLEDFYKQTDAEFRMVEEDIPAPPRNEDTTPDYEYENDNEGTRDKIESPLIAEGRDMDNVGSRKVKAYQYENPEVKPFFQAMAKEMQYDLMNSTKGERIIIGDISQTGGGDFEYLGVKRHTTSDIADLLDNYNYTYSDIYKGLDAIIKDHGAENIAVAKRIEFALDDRLRNGYTAVDGLKIPANQDYIDLLNEKSWSDYYSSIPNNDIAPIETNLEQDSVIAPTIENIAKTPTNQSLAIEQAPTEFDNGGPMIRVSPEMQKRTLNKPTESKNVDWEALEDTSKGEQQNLKVKKLGETIERKEVDWDSLEDTSNSKQKQYNPETGQLEDAIEKKTKKEIKEKLLKETGILNANLDEANKIPKALMENTDPIRLQEMVFGRSLGNQINDMFFQKVKDNTSEKIRFQNKERAEIKDLGIKARSKESAAVQKYGEKQWVNEYGELVPYGDKELANDFPDVEVQNKIKKASQIIRQKYDSYLDTTNKVLTELGYDAIPKRDDYMRHFQELNDIFSRVGIPYNYNEMTANDLPTDINGLTHDFSPSKNFFANALRRTGVKTTYDAITGIDGYLEGIGNLIYHTEDIQRLRAYEQYIRDTYGENHGYDNIETLSDEQKVERIEKIQDNHLSNYASWLHEYTNTLAGKKSLVDRGVEHFVGRRIYSFLNTTKSQVGKNMIGFNISSAMTNAIAGVQSLAKTNKIASVKGLADSVKNIFRNDGFVDKNNFLTSRFGSDSISKNWWQRVGDAGFVFMQGMDHFVSNFVVRSKYNELKSKGLSDEQAHIEAGKFASRLMSDRSQGAMPNLYNSQMLGIVTQFQNEVNNQLYSMFYDTYHESRESAQGKALKTTAGMTFTLGQLAVFTHIFGTAFESMAGYNPTFDIIGILMKAFGFDDDEDSEDTVGDNLEQAFKQLGNSLPYISTFTGGRVPTSEAFKGITDTYKALTGGKDEYGQDVEWSDAMKSAIDSAHYFFLPTGYSQAKKTVQGLEMYDEDLPIAGSYTDSGNLRFTADESTWGKVQAGIFGRWANDEAQAYVDSEFKTINKSSIDELVDLDMKSSEYRKLKEKINKSGKKVEDKVDYIATLNELTDSQKNILVNNILDRDYDVDVSNYEDYSSYDEFNFYYKNREKYDWLKEEGISYEEYSATDESKELYNYAYRYPETYKVGKAITGDFATYKEHADYIWDLKADKDENGDSISGTKKTKVIEYVNSLDLSIPQKAMLIRKTYSSFDDYNNDIVDYVESLDEDYDTKKTILEELDFTLDEDGYVYWD